MFRKKEKDYFDVGVALGQLSGYVSSGSMTIPNLGDTLIQVIHVKWEKQTMNEYEWYRSVSEFADKNERGMIEWK